MCVCVCVLCVLCVCVHVCVCVCVCVCVRVCEGMCVAMQAGRGSSMMATRTFVHPLGLRCGVGIGRGMFGVCGTAAILSHDDFTHHP